MPPGQRHTPSASASARAGTPGHGVAVGGRGVDVGEGACVGSGVSVGVAVGTAVWVGVRVYVGVGEGARVGVRVGIREGVTVRVGISGLGATVDEGFPIASEACAESSAARGGKAAQPTEARSNRPMKRTCCTTPCPRIALFVAAIITIDCSPQLFGNTYDNLVRRSFFLLN